MLKRIGRMMLWLFPPEPPLYSELKKREKVEVEKAAT